MGPCFGCGLPGHILKDCPALHMKAEKHKQKAKKEFRKASDKEVEVANLCLMANDVQETEPKDLDEVDYSDLLEYSKDELTQALIRCIQCEQEYLSKIKIFKKTIHNLLSEKEMLQRENDDLHLKIEHLQKEKEEVQSKCRAFEKLALKFTKDQDIGQTTWFTKNVLQ